MEASNSAARPAETSAVIINFRTADETSRAISSLRAFYPSLPLLLIDNGSNDQSTEALRAFCDKSPGTTELLINDHNRYHGPAMHQALRHLSSRLVFLMDSDCVIQRGGFLELMAAQFDGTDKAYAVGKRVYMNKRGYDTASPDKAFLYVRPFFMLLKREVYLALPPFAHHGTPCLANMREANRRGFSLIDFPVEQYVTHGGRGTAGKYGYGLGWRGKLNHLLNKLGL